MAGMCASMAPMRRMPSSTLAMISGSPSASSMPKLARSWSMTGRNGHRLPEGQALALQPGDRFPGGGQGTTAFQHQARLANARLARDGDHLPMARLRLLEQVQQRRQLAVTSDARREAALGRHLQAGAPPTRPQHFIDAHGLRMPLDGVLPQVARLEKARHQLGAWPR